MKQRGNTDQAVPAEFEIRQDSGGPYIAVDDIGYRPLGPTSLALARDHMNQSARILTAKESEIFVSVGKVHMWFTSDPDKWQAPQAKEPPTMGFGTISAEEILQLNQLDVEAEAKKTKAEMLSTMSWLAGLANRILATGEQYRDAAYRSERALDARNEASKEQGNLIATLQEEKRKALTQADGTKRDLVSMTDDRDYWKNLYEDSSTGLAEASATNHALEVALVAVVEKFENKEEDE